MYWACLQRNKSNVTLACSIHLDEWGVPAWFPQEADTDTISMRKFIWRALWINTCRRKGKNSGLGRGGRCVFQGRPWMTPTGWGYSGPPQWSQVVTGQPCLCIPSLTSSQGQGTPGQTGMILFEAVFPSWGLFLVRALLWRWAAGSPLSSWGPKFFKSAGGLECVQPIFPH